MWVQQDPILPAPPRRHRWFVPLAIMTTVLLVAAVVGAVVIGGDDDEGTERDPAVVAGTGQTIEVTPDGAPAGLTGIAAEIAAELPAMMRFIEQARGLEFKEPVKVELLSDEAFRARLDALDEDPDNEERVEIENDERVLRALGLLDGDVDLEEATDSLLGDAVAGFYDTEKDELVVRGDRLTPGVRITFVHELTHALQAQHFDLEREDLDERDDEAAQSFSAVVEGDASRIEEMYVDTLPEDQQKAAQLEEIEAASGIDPTIPQILLELISFPYALGPDFTRALVDGGAQARLDAAFKEPPTTSEQIIRPDLYLDDGEPPRDVVKPKPDGGAEVIDQGVMGQLGMILILGRLVDQRTAVLASQGWGGDWYVAWRDGDDACVRTNMVMDTAGDAREMADALRQAAKKRDGLDVAVTPDLITFTSCG